MIPQLINITTLELRRDLVKRQITLCKNNINTLHPESKKY